MTLNSGIELPSDRIAEICKRYGVRELAVFGSAARADLVTKSGLKPRVRSEVLGEAQPVYSA
jgi:predicted nucleotidyltransferase